MDSSLSFLKVLYPDAAGHLCKLFINILGIEIQSFGLAVLCSHPQSARHLIDSDHTFGAQQVRNLIANWPTGPQPHTATVSPG